MTNKGPTSDGPRAGGTVLLRRLPHEARLAQAVRTALPSVAGERLDPKHLVLRCERCQHVPRRAALLVQTETGFVCRAEEACDQRAWEARENDPTIDYGAPLLRQRPPRTCHVCGGSYAYGGYADHRLGHGVQA